MVLLLAGLVIKWQADRYLRGSAFLELLSRKTSDAFRIDGKFSPLVWNGPEIYSEDFSTASPGAGPLESLRVTNLRARLLWNSLWQGKWEIDHLETQQAEMLFQSDGSAPVAATEVSDSALPPFWLAWLPRQVQINRVLVQSARLEWAGSVLERTRLELRPDGPAWLIEARQGRLLHRLFPENTVEEIRARLTKDSLYLTAARIHLEPDGTLQAHGEADFLQKTSRFQIEVANLPLEKIAATEVQAHLKGFASGQATLNYKVGQSTISGKFQIQDGLLQGLGVQEVLARFTRSPQFKRLPLQEFSADFEMASNDSVGADGITFRQIVIESRGLLRIEGSLHIGPDSSLQGQLEVGLTSQSLQWLPGSQERVFRTSRSGYLWTPVQLSGTLQEPKENLSGRLALALGEEVILAPVKLLGQGGISTVEGSAEVLESGGQILRTGSETAAEGIQSILDLLGPLRPPAPAKREHPNSE